MKTVIDEKIVCKSCGGTGLYKGMAELGDCAVICTTCKGTGCQDFHYEYEKFEKRILRHNIKRVFKSSCGYAHTDKDMPGCQFSKAGCSYGDFLDGVEPLPVKELYCPYLFSNQAMQNKGHKDYSFYKYFCKEQVDKTLGKRISDCEMFKNKGVCWRRLEE